VKDGLLSWQINRAVATFGRALEEKLHQVSSKASKQRDAERKMKQTLDKWMSSADPTDAPSKGRYRDPMATL
jgi:hypothetical protein